MTEGGPGFATTNTALFVYNTAYRTFLFGKAFAAGLILLLIIIPFILLYYKIVRRK
ncbi:MAG: hypothetical protein QXI58_05780 [Candidatus Micrarchaeia archaeon]